MARIVDLSLTVRPGMRGVEMEQSSTVEGQGWNARTLHLYSHSGTHMDAQTHFAAGPETIDMLPLERCVTWAYIVRLDAVGDKRLIGVEDLGALAEAFEPGRSLLLQTGWSRHAASRLK